MNRIAKLVGDRYLGAGRLRFERGSPQPQAFRRDAMAAGRGMGGVSACGRPGGKASVYFLFEVVPLEMAQGKGAEGMLRPGAGLQAGPEEGGEDDVEMKVQFGLGAGLAVVEAQVLLGIAEGKLNLEAGAVQPEEAFRCQCQVGAVQEHSLRRLRVGPAGQDVDHPQPALPGLAVQDPVVEVDLFVGQRRAGQARQGAAVEVAVELPAATQRAPRLSRAPAATASRSRNSPTSTTVSRPVAAPQVCRRARTVPGDCRAQRG